MYGRVQGVGFRWWTRSQAVRLGITGTVRNCEDGTVEVHARGSAEAVSELRHLLSVGPPGARVSRVEDEAVFQVPTDGFQIAG